MPTTRKTNLHAFRISDELYEAARDKARREGTSLSELIRDFLAEYVDDLKE